MRICPNCGEKTIPLKWMLFEKADGQKGRCYICNHCGERIKKKKFLGFVLDFEIELLFLLMVGFTFLLHSLLASFLAALLMLIFIHISINGFAILQVADEGYCRGDMTKIGAFFGLIVMFAMIAIMIDFFIIKPFFE
ncbi:MAG: hypothetical protein AB7S65_02885 [Sulfuricurvum sp.]